MIAVAGGHGVVKTHADSPAHAGHMTQAVGMAIAMLPNCIFDLVPDV